VAGGCLFSLVLVVAGAAFAGVTFYHRLQNLSCLPSDFPTYPGSTVGSYSYELNGPTPGNSCQMVFESHDGVGAVLDYYQTRLNRGDWQISSINQDGGQIAFRSVKRARTTGTLGVATRADRTEITVQLYS